MTIFEFTTILLSAVFITCPTISEMYALQQVEQISNDSLMFVHTLDGSIFLVNRRSGFLYWQKQLNPTLVVSYNEGPILIVDPIDGRLYEYSSIPDDDILQRLKHSLMGHIRRSPAYFKNYLSSGSKTDFWMSLDVNTGALYQSSPDDSVSQCPKQLPVAGGHKTTSGSTAKQTSVDDDCLDVIGIGRTEYNLVLRDSVNGKARLNVTYTTFATHTDADMQNTDLLHVVTTQPNMLLTFKGRKLVWSFSLFSPVVGLYSIWSPPSRKPSVPTLYSPCESTTSNPLTTSSSTDRQPSPRGRLSRKLTDDDGMVEVDDLQQHSHERTPEPNYTDPATKPPRLLRRIAFNTYVLNLEVVDGFDVGAGGESNHKKLLFHQGDWLWQHLETKFSNSLDLTLSLHVGSSSSAPLYAVACLAEASLKLRTVHRSGEVYMLEGPSVPGPSVPLAPALDEEGTGSATTWPYSLTGLYVLPTVREEQSEEEHRWEKHSGGGTGRWSDDDCREAEGGRATRCRRLRVPRLRQITDGTTRWAVIAPPSSSPSYDVGLDQPRPAGQRPEQPRHKASEVPPTDWLLLMSQQSPLPTAIVITVLLTLLVTRIIAPPSVSVLATLLPGGSRCGPSTERDSTTGCLPVHFDSPGEDGWAGCSAEEAGQPEDIRFNLKEVLGHGANGTMVFAGTFGSRPTAVKRIVRQKHMEKQWRREHAILLNQQQHPHLLRCYWTGSTANFHYLVLQRCAVTLTQALSSGDSADDADGGESGLARYGLTPVAVMHQFCLAVASLHQNRIVHRDLKPSNVLITAGESTCVSGGGVAPSLVVVGDFGLSRPLPLDRQELTNSFSAADGLLATAGSLSRPSGHAPATTSNTGISGAGLLFGTLGWMAPELCRLDGCQAYLSYAIDIYAAGLLAYHVFTGGGHAFDEHTAGDGSDGEAQDRGEGHGCTGAAADRPPGSRRTGPSSSASTTGSQQSQAGLHFSAASQLSPSHAHHLAIAGGCRPRLEPLTDSCQHVEPSVGYLVRQLIEAMLKPNPADRPTAEEVVLNPLFWSPDKVTRFLSEISDILDTRDVDQNRTETSSVSSTNPTSRSLTTSTGEKRNNNHNSGGGGHSRPSHVDSHLFKRHALLLDVERYAGRVFDKLWFCRLEPEVLNDLLGCRGYKGSSLTSLLRAVRNKRNHMWSLPDHVLRLYGGSYAGMARYWTSRFPVLLPVIHSLCRCHLVGMPGLSDFLVIDTGHRNTPLAASDLIGDWLQDPSPTPDNLLFDVTSSPDNGRISTGGPRAYSRHQWVNTSWVRGQVVISSMPSKPSPPPTTMTANQQLSPQDYSPSRDDSARMEVGDVVIGESESALAESEEGEFQSVPGGKARPRHRRRPNQPKKVRPTKHKTTNGRQTIMAVNAAGDSEAATFVP